MKRTPSPPQIQGRLAGAMTTLDERSQLLVELYLRGLSLSAIAATVGISDEALAAELADTIERIRARLAD